MPEDSTMTDPVEVIPMSGFDPEGEPELRRTADGRLWLVFNFLPPSWAADESAVDRTMDQELEAAVRVPIVWEDREVFRIDQPRSDTVERVRRFLTEYRRRL